MSACSAILLATLYALCVVYGYSALGLIDLNDANKELFKYEDDDRHS